MREFIINIDKSDREVLKVMDFVLKPKMMILQSGGEEQGVPSPRMAKSRAQILREREEEAL